MKINNYLLNLLFSFLCLTITGSFIQNTLADEASLKLLSTGAEEITGGFAPQQLARSTKCPAGLKIAPTNIRAPLYGTIMLGPREKPGAFFVIVDEPSDQPARLFVDGNGNGNFGDDQTATRARNEVARKRGPVDVPAVHF